MMRFDHCVLDPPWRYANRLSGKGRTRFGSGASGKYRTESTAEQAKFPIGELAAPGGCNYHMWVTGPFLPDAFQLMAAYGLTYSTIEFVWVKVNNWAVKYTRSRIVQALYGLTLLPFLAKICFRGPGHYTASNVELVLLAYKGRPKLPQVKMSSQLIFAPRTDHSRKPDHVHRWIETAYPGQRYVELYARQTRPGWQALGDELDGQDIRDSLPILLNRCPAVGVLSNLKDSGEIAIGT